MTRDDLQHTDRLATVDEFEGGLSPEKPQQTNGNDVDGHQLQDAARLLDRGSRSPLPDPQPATEQPGTPILNETSVTDSTIRSKGPTDCETASHLARLEDFAKEMSTAATTILSKRANIARVVVVISYWQDAVGLDHLRKNAKKLHKFFQECKFETREYEISREAESVDLIIAFSEEHRKIRKESNSLFILYYGGHAKLKEDGTRVWRSEDHDHAPFIDWSAVTKPVFENSQCRKLFIFDCCFAGAMIDHKPEWQGTCEVLGACSPDVKASARESSSFTRAVCKQLKSRTYDICELHSALCDSETMKLYELKATPYYRDWAGQSHSSVIRSKADSTPDSQEVKGTPAETLQRFCMSTTRVLIQVKFKGNVAGFREQMEHAKSDWKRWFHHAPDNIAALAMTAVEEVLLHSLFESNSCTTIWTMPLWLWDTMPSIGGCQYLGIVRSRDHISPGIRLPGLQPLTTKESELSSVPQPKLLPQAAEDSRPPKTSDDPASFVKSAEKRAVMSTPVVRDRNHDPMLLLPLPRPTRFAHSLPPAPEVHGRLQTAKHSAFGRSQGEPAEEELNRKIKNRRILFSKSRDRLGNLPPPAEGGRLSMRIAVAAR